MKRHTKITLQEIMKRKEQMLEAKKGKKTAEIYIESLDGTIIIQEPSRSLCYRYAGWRGRYVFDI